jgi:large subunit ribosomal protein L9e
VNFPTEDPVTGKKIAEGSMLEIRNFLGEFFVRRIPMRPGVRCYRSEEVKDEIVLEGNDLSHVSQTGLFYFIS